MNSNFEVYYFPLQLRAEPIRLILAYAGANWSNRNVVDWPKEKFNTEGLLYNQVPMLIQKETDGSEFTMVQSNAIKRYLANIFNLYPADAKKKALVDSYHDGIDEMQNKVMGAFMGAKPEEVENVAKNFRNTDSDLSKFLKINESILAKNHNGNGYYMNEQVSYVDLCAYAFVVLVNGFPGMKDFINTTNAPNLMKVFETINRNANIKKYKNDINKHLIHSGLNPTVL